jgi:DNA modification methylase
MKVESTSVGSLVPYIRNSRTHSNTQVAQIAASIKEFGFCNPVLVDADGGIIAGHGRVLAAKKLGMEKVPTVRLSHLTDAQKRAYVIADNKLALNAGWDMDLLEIEMQSLGDDGFDLRLLGFNDDTDPGAKGSMAERFGAPPFSVLNAREGWWQDRKREWLALGIKSEVGRARGLLDFSALGRISGLDRGGKDGSDSSVFDPVLCELSYRWFSPSGGVVLDPFAGGSVRGIVASELGREYIGYDLSKEQVEANRAQADKICRGIGPVWINGDSLSMALDINADMVFSCPPYVDLESYSDDPRDLSNMSFEQFVENYARIIRRSCEQLRDNRFAVFVVGEVRRKDGSYYNFVSETIKAFLDAGLEYYNEMILVTRCGSLPIRAGRSFTVSRKIGKTHQNVLVFLKGDARQATEAMAPIMEGDGIQL